MFAGRTPLAKSPTRSGTTESQTGWPITPCVNVVLSCRCCRRHGIFWSSFCRFLEELNAHSPFYHNFFGKSNTCFLHIRNQSSDVKPTLPKKSSVEVKKVKPRCEFMRQQLFSATKWSFSFPAISGSTTSSVFFPGNSCSYVFAGRTRQRSKLGNNSLPSRNLKGPTSLP